MADETKKDSAPASPAAPVPPFAQKNVVLQAITSKEEGARKETDKPREKEAAAKRESASPKPAGEKDEGSKSSPSAAKKSSPSSSSSKKPPLVYPHHSSYIAEMLLSLDGYDDIFSDFDPRNYELRELSEDFLKELGKRYKETPKGGFEVHFLLPSHVRQAHLEARIKKRLRHYFARELSNVERQIRKKRETGLKFLAAGVLVLALQTWLLFSPADRFLSELLGVLVVPAGWFLVWNGIERVLLEPEGLVSLRDYYRKFFKCEYIFTTDEKQKK